MNPFSGFTDKRLLENIARLERDIQDFDHRASLVKTVLERQDRFSPSEPLYQRFTSIRNHLRADLQLARDELEAREQARSGRPKWSLRSAVAALVGARAGQ